MGSLWLRHEGVSIEVTWPGGAMEMDAFVKTLNAVTAAWSAVTGRVARGVPASALTYSAEEAGGD